VTPIDGGSCREMCCSTPGGGVYEYRADDEFVKGEFVAYSLYSIILPCTSTKAHPPNTHTHIESQIHGLYNNVL
jgi:hypothetical protein